MVLKEKKRSEKPTKPGSRLFQRPGAVSVSVRAQIEDVYLHPDLEFSR